MAKWGDDSVANAALAVIATCDRMFVCSGAAAPANYAAASGTADLATHNLTAGDGNGDWTIANGDSSGRKLTLAQQATITVDHSGDATHIAFGVSGTTTLLWVCTCTTQTLTQGNTVTVPAFDVDEIADPA